MPGASTPLCEEIRYEFINCLAPLISLIFSLLFEMREKSQKIVVGLFLLPCRVQVIQIKLALIVL